MSFPLIGNERLKNSVKSFIAADRIPHALLIEGDKGIGKHTLAKFIAKAAVCKGENKPCFSCDSCHLSEVGSHPDIVFTAPEDGKKNISVEQIRSLRQQAFIKAHIANKRVFIVDRADTMNDQAQNALLKVLEEPPAGVVFILVASSRTALLETIVSRCVTLTPAVPEKGIAIEYLENLGKGTRQEIEETLKESGGRIGRALELLENAETDKVLAAAVKFLDFFEESNEWEMLKLLQGFEKDRAGTDLLFAALKNETAHRLRGARPSSIRAKALNRFYDQLCSDEQLLKTNINLSMLFSAMVCRAVHLNKD